jgi:hypothetical protein
MIRTRIGMAAVPGESVNTHPNALEQRGSKNITNNDMPRLIGGRGYTREIQHLCWKDHFPRGGIVAKRGTACLHQESFCRSSDPLSPAMFCKTVGIVSGISRGQSFPHRLTEFPNARPLASTLKVLNCPSPDPGALETDDASRSLGTESVIHEHDRIIPSSVDPLPEPIMLFRSRLSAPVSSMGVYRPDCQLRRVFRATGGLQARLPNAC